MTAPRIIKLLFCFKKPEVVHLSYCHVYIKDKPVLFAVWELQNAFAVKLIPLKRWYFNNTKAVVISIPEDLEFVTLKAANFWRKTIIVLAIRTVELDAATAAHLIEGFRPLNKASVSLPQVSGINSRVVIRPVLRIQQRQTYITRIKSFDITIQSFNYP